MKPRAIIFDLDWTLCELSDSSNPYNHDWEEAIIPEMYQIWVWVRFTCDTRIILTGRKRKDFWEITEKWLEKNWFCYTELIMQEWSTAQKNHIYKREKLIELKEKYEILALVDDNPDMIPVCKELGILMLHVKL